MARQKDIKLEDGTWVLLGIEPDWDTINELAKKVDEGELSVLNELIDLVLDEEETEKMMKYIELGAKLGNDKARYLMTKELNDWNIKKVLLLREFANKGISGSKYDYEDTRNGFTIFYCTLAVLLIIGYGIAYVLYEFLRPYYVEVVNVSLGNLVRL